MLQIFGERKQYGSREIYIMRRAVHTVKMAERRYE
jgi:hypothetical protein